MAKTTHVDAQHPDDVLLLVGTMKGAFLFHSDANRERWSIGGPYFPGQSVYALALDRRAGRNRLWAATSSMHWGSVLCSSDDLGRTWTVPEEANVKFPEETEKKLEQIWQITPGADDDTLYVGVNPASLFVSRDAGGSFALHRPLFDHPHRPRWEPGGGGLCLHTILVDGSRIVVAISTGGVYRSDDSGESWAPKNRGIRADFRPEKQPEFGQCVHKVVRHPARPERLFAQNHGGVYRSDDSGESWSSIAEGLPSDFGFPMAMHPHDPDTVYVLPLESDRFRVTPEARLRVYRSRDAGGKWEALTRGLPQEGAYETVLRDALTVDRSRSAGVYFGTRGGKVYASSDEGDSWNLVHASLPPIVCVKTA